MDGDGRIAFDFGLFDLDSLTLEARKVQEIIQLPDNDWEIKGLAEIKWPNDVELGPDECFMVPSCNETSRGLDALYIVAIVVSVLFVAGMATAIVIVVWRKLVHRDMSKGQHKVLLSSEDLVFLRKRDVQKGSKMLSSSLIERPDLIKASTGEKQSANRSLASLHEYADITDTARYNGDLVHVKELKVKNFELKTKVLNVIKSLREIRHENVNAVVGFYEEPESPAFITDFCTRGSLEDVLKNHDIKLDWDFKVSLLTDLIRGVRYIHNSSVRWHGNLKCRNCLIDSRWVLKVSDFGLSGFYGAAKLSPKYQNTDLLWTAPEHLRQPVPPLHGSERGDVFSIAIIMQCVVLRSDPYSTSGLSPAEIIQKLRHPPPLLRPSVSHGTAPPQYIQLMKMCWTENPEMRPSIEEVYQQYKLFTGGKKMNIVDTMFRMLEKYSTDLEELVKDRTLQLEEEKKKTDLLLYRMLPPVVADSLKVGRTIAAEQFSEVTIYFSDIVGFTTISANSTPMQVVDLLNDLYTMFDATIDAYDVYKVETIGDAYMVCSGLPVRNENRHAGEISTMALDLLAQCGHFTIKHMPEVPLRVRIGLHSGPCVAGVVGLTMPRYCLFGDTVNTASRMESTGSAYRIHISEAVRVTLDELGGYHFRYRGEVELKGKGMAKTYWLVGKDGFDKELPTPPPVTNGDNHGISLEDFKLKALKRTDTTGLFKICHTDSKSSIESEKNDNNGEHKPNDSKLIVVKPVDCDACVDHNNEAKHADCKSDPSHDPPEGQSRNNQGSNDSGIASRGDASYIIEEARPDAMIPQTSKPSRHSALVGAGASKGAHCLTDNSTIKAVANPSRSVLPQSPLYMNGKEHSVNPMSNISTKNFKHQSVVTELVEVTSESVRDQTRDSYPLHESLPEGHTLEGSEVNANETDTNTKEVYLKNKGLRPTLDATSENTKSPNNLSSTPGAFNACNCNLKNLELVPRGQSVLVNGKTMVYSNGSNKEKHCLICNSNYTTEEHNLDIFRESLV
ncbi:hypothetical protein DPMN_133085 [Dreissena polymorpha]|uniref:Guanylate cyclase n=1 Tax=Dreissena polymorpha TaxID=45954 RepID=A0A9D4FXT8_DREPO|nr:hypothetical protein DPMN_133085 [Dreissena polymorpha]